MGALAVRLRTMSNNWPRPTSTMPVAQALVRNRPHRHIRCSSRPSARVSPILAVSAASSASPQRLTDSPRPTASQIRSRLFERAATARLTRDPEAGACRQPLGLPNRATSSTRCPALVGAPSPQLSNLTCLSDTFLRRVHATDLAARWITHQHQLTSLAEPRRAAQPRLFERT